ncbi:nudC domain-containing protein 3-like isoform X1 [Asterias rubens]|uniref:nudC domain-containing protein 3-like isoform X1 n=1 Tax=Asterias rubens TaxID=7604 RepID=UPI001455CE7E|nr:nudC domain-containing protein 3-like isoform X1 [Asterias rubens]
MAAPMAGKFDGNLCDILQHVQQIDTFLDVMFEFLYRRTDFYKLMRHEHDTMGLPPGMAKKLVMKAFTKYEKIGNGPPLEELESSLMAAVPNPSNTVEITELPDVEKPSSREESKSEDVGERKERLTDETNEDRGEVAGETVKQDLSSTTLQQKRTSAMISSADTYNGALRETYAWAQTLHDLDVKVFVPETLKKAKDLKVEIKEDSIKVAVQSHHAGTSEPQVLIEGKLTMKIRCDESIWSLHPGSYVQLSLEKHRDAWWRAVVQGEPEIDNKSISNVQNVSDMDEDAQQDYQRVMFDMEQKRQGKPTIKEMETQEILRKAWNTDGSPFKGTEFDPSALNITT